MKNKLLYFSIVVIVFVLSISAAIYSKKDDYRYHQHLEEKITTECNHGKKEKFCTHLPIICVNTGSQIIPGEAVLDDNNNVIDYTRTIDGNTMVSVDISIKDSEKNNHIEDDSIVESKAMFRIRGNSSRHFDKKSYKIEFTDENGAEKNIGIMGMSEDDEWALNGPFLDKTLIRNYLCLNISGEIMGYSPNVRFCELFVDGEYMGLYLMMETVSAGKDRVDITKYKEGKRGYGYILKLDNKEADVDSLKNLNQFSYYTFKIEYQKNLSIEYPGKSKLTSEVKNNIEKELSMFEKTLFSYDFDNSYMGYEKYIDVDSFVDYYILMEFLCVNDMLSMSTYLHKDAKGKLTMGPVWDFNNAMNNFISADYDGKEMYYTNRVWYNMLFKDKKFTDKVIKRYRNLRKTYLSEDYLINYIEEVVSYISEPAQRNFDVWGYSFDHTKLNSFQKLRPYERNPKSYEEAINQMKEFIKHRGKWLDEHIDTLYQHCHESKNKAFIE